MCWSRSFLALEHAKIMGPRIDPANRSIIALVAGGRRTSAVRINPCDARKNLAAHRFQISLHRIEQRLEPGCGQGVTAQFADSPSLREAIIELVALVRVRARIQLTKRAGVKAARMLVGPLAGLLGLPQRGSPVGL